MDLANTFTLEEQPPVHRKREQRQDANTLLVNDNSKLKKKRAPPGRNELRARKCVLHPIAG